MRIENKIFHTHDTIYSAEIYLILAPRKELAGIIKRKWGDETQPDPHHHACSWKVENLYKKRDTVIDYIIWMQQFDWSIQDQTTLIHEIFHTVSKIMNDRGILYDPDNTEPFAYYLDWVMGELWNALKPSHPKMRRKK
jgi:hypothetical protein